MATAKKNTKKATKVTTKELTITLTTASGKSIQKDMATLHTSSMKASEKCVAIATILMKKKVPFAEVTQTLAATYTDWPIGKNGLPVGLSTMRKPDAKKILKDYTKTDAYMHVNGFESIFRRMYQKDDNGFIIKKVKSTKKTKTLKVEEDKAKVALNRIKALAAFMEKEGLSEEAQKALREAMGYLI